MGIGPGSSRPICPGSRLEPGPMGLAPGPHTLVPVRGSNRDRRGSFSPGSSHEPGQMSCLYIPHRRSRALHSALFFLAAVDRPHRSRRWHHHGEPLVLIFFLKEKILTLDRYLSNFLTFIIACYYIVRWFWYPPPLALILSMIRM